MIDYRAGVWGFHVAWGWNGSLAPRALTMALPNAFLTFIFSTMLLETPERFPDGFVSETNKDSSQMILTTCTVVMTFILYNRSRTSYNRWWEGGTLLQKTRGEWFNAYSSIMAFTSTKPEHEAAVKEYVHLMARLMSLLMCCALQQVSPNRNRRFEIIDLEGIEEESMVFLNSAPDKVEIILQWIQRSMIIQQSTGVLPVAPPILSRAFQEVSRGIVNLQNARKIADFPYPYPLAQISMVLQMLHWIMTPVVASLAAPRWFAVFLAFASIFCLWCIHFNALDLEFPFGARVNDLPMHEMQRDWNHSLCSLLNAKGAFPPKFQYDPTVPLTMAMSDASDLLVPTRTQPAMERHNVALIKMGREGRKLPAPPRASELDEQGQLESPGGSKQVTPGCALPTETIDDDDGKWSSEGTKIGKDMIDSLEGQRANIRMTYRNSGIRSSTSSANSQFSYQTGHQMSHPSGIGGPEGQSPCMSGDDGRPHRGAASLNTAKQLPLGTGSTRSSADMTPSHSDSYGIIPTGSHGGIPMQGGPSRISMDIPSLDPMIESPSGSFVAAAADSSPSDLANIHRPEDEEEVIDVYQSAEGCGVSADDLPGSLAEAGTLEVGPVRSVSQRLMVPAQSLS